MRVWGERKKEGRKERERGREKRGEEVQAEQRKENGSANLALKSELAEQECRSQSLETAPHCCLIRVESFRETRRDPPRGNKRRENNPARTCRRGADAEGEPV